MALVSSGDAGVHGMAGVLLGVCGKNDVKVRLFLVSSSRGGCIGGTANARFCRD